MFLGGGGYNFFRMPKFSFNKLFNIFLIAVRIFYTKNKPAINLLRIISSQIDYFERGITICSPFNENYIICYNKYDQITCFVTLHLSSEFCQKLSISFCRVINIFVLFCWKGIWNFEPEDTERVKHKFK